MLSDKDYELLDKVLVKLKQADCTCSDVVLGPEEVRVLVDDFDDVNNQLLKSRRSWMSLKKDRNEGIRTLS